jgi:hypothetical protein
MFHNVGVSVMDKTKDDQVPWTEDGIQWRQRVLFGGESRPMGAPAPGLSEASRAWAAMDKTSIAALVRGAVALNVNRDSSAATSTFAIDRGTTVALVFRDIHFGY